MLKGIEIIKDRLQRKRKQYIHQGEKIEQMKCTMQNTGEEIEQLEYVLNEIEHIADLVGGEVFQRQERTAFQINGHGIVLLLSFYSQNLSKASK